MAAPTGGAFNAKYWKQGFEELDGSTAATAAAAASNALEEEEEEDADDEEDNEDNEDEDKLADGNGMAPGSIQKMTKSKPYAAVATSEDGDELATKMDDGQFCIYLWFAIFIIGVLTVGAVAMLRVYFGGGGGAEDFAKSAAAVGTPSPSPRTSSPIYAPTTTTIRPTPAPLQQQQSTSSPTTLPLPAPVYTLPDSHYAQWDEQRELKLAIKTKKTSIEGLGGADALNKAFRDLVCDVKPNPPVKYAFPPREYATKQSPERFLEHVRAMRFALLEYYHVRAYDSAHFYDAFDAKADKVKQRLSDFFTSRLLMTTDTDKSKNNAGVVVGAMGTSVLSGQDNCNDATYGRLLQRQLQHLLAPWQTQVEVRNMGQNGDGPSHLSQIVCGADALGPGVDFLHTWYAMISPTEGEVSRRAFIQRMIHQQQHASSGAGGMLANIHTVIAKGGAEYCSPELVREGVCTRISGLLKDLDWSPKHFWGRVDNGLCHNNTREGYYGTLMQNWHFGPIGFEIFTDQALFVYMDGLELALERLLAGQPLFGVTPVKDIANKPSTAACEAQTQQEHQSPWPHWWNVYTCEKEDTQPASVHCLGGMEPNWNADFDLQRAHVNPADSRFPSGGGAAAWEYIQYKHASTLRPNDRERSQSPQYATTPGCSDFPDVGYSYSTSLPSVRGASTPWLSFRVPASVLPTTTAGSAGRMFVYLCVGRRDDKGATMGRLGKFTVQVGVKGKAWGRAEFAAPHRDCLLVTPNAIPIPQQPEQDEIGFQFINDNEYQGGGGKPVQVHIGFIAFVGELDEHRAVPTPTQQLIVPEQTASSSVDDAEQTEEEDEEGDNEPERAPSPEDNDRAPAPNNDEEDEPERAPSPDNDRAPSPDNNNDADEPERAPSPFDDRRMLRRRQR